MKIIAHRGALGLAPENTLAAIRKGMASGADEIEIDVQVTKDNIPILWHYRLLEGQLIAERTLAELRTVKADLATLDEAVKEAGRKRRLIIEVKPRVPTAPVIAVLKPHFTKGLQPQDIAFASFSQNVLTELHQALPEVETIINQRFSGLWATYRARKLGTKRLCMNRRFIWWGFIKSMHRHGYELTAYTLNDPQKAARWERHGLAGVVTDYPNRFKQT